MPLFPPVTSAIFALSLPILCLSPSRLRYLLPAATTLNPGSRASHHVQVRIRCTRPHDVGTVIAVCRWQARGLWVKRPQNHPVRAHVNRRAGRIVGVGIAALRGTRQHVGDPWDCCGWLGLVRFGISKPLQRNRIDAHRGLPNNL